MINIDTIALQAATDIMALPSANDLLGGAGQLKAEIQIIVRGYIEDAVDKVTQHAQSAWIDATANLPQCDMQPNSFGVPVMVRLSAGYETEGFYGCRVTDKPEFYMYGSALPGVTHWKRRAPLHESGSAAAPEYRNDPSVQGMADCMDMVRGELIEAGIVDAKTAPMFLVEAVCRHIAALNREILELKRVYEERGNQIARLDTAVERCNIAAAPAIAVPTEVERDAALEEAAKLCDFQATWAKGEAEDIENSVRYRHENRERQIAAELCAASIRAAIATGEKK